ncbi:MAG: hypothetical protein IK152_04235 [Lachnospiraceae bacterium]|nr:hypothetical protein [Lachnospiraceae bacterium]
MDRKAIKEVLDKLANDPKAQELLKSYDKPEPGKEAAVYAEVASKLGYDISDADITGYIDKSTEAMKKRSEANMDKIEALPDEDLGQVAGGGEKHSNCSYSYLDKENCWAHDGCDLVWNHYSDYICHLSDWNYACHKSETEKKCGKPQQTFLECEWEYSM